jgi:ApaG protein
VEQLDNQIKIVVRSQFNEMQSNVENEEFFFTYHIVIQNLSQHTVQLLARKWVIVDSNGESRYVEGEGVVGEQPIINVGESYEYYSGCLLKTGFGKMEGVYSFVTLPDFKQFEVDIPEFNLVLPWVMN